VGTSEKIIFISIIDFFKISPVILSIKLIFGGMIFVVLNKDCKEVIKILKAIESTVVTVECVSRGTTSTVKATIDFARGDVAY